MGAASRAFGKRRQRPLRRRLVPLGAQAVKLLDLTRAHGRGVNLQHVEVPLYGWPKSVTPVPRLAAGIDTRLRSRRRLFNAPLGQAALDRPGHPAEAFDLIDVRLRPSGQFGREALYVIRAAPGVDDLRCSGLLDEKKLGVARNTSRERG